MVRTASLDFAIVLFIEINESGFCALLTSVEGKNNLTVSSPEGFFTVYTISMPTESFTPKILFTSSLSFTNTVS